MEVQQAEYGSSTRASTLKAGHLFAAEIAAVHGFTLEELQTHCRIRRAVHARWACWHALRSAPYRWSLPRIAKLFNHDHTSVLYGLRAVERERQRAMTVANDR